MAFVKIAKMDFINLKKLLFEKHNSKNKSTLTTCEKAFTMYAICHDKHADYKKTGCSFSLEIHKESFCLC